VKGSEENTAPETRKLQGEKGFLERGAPKRKFDHS
jgi:hypothetical protein